MLGDCLLTLVFNQESHSGTSTLILRNLEEIVQSPSPGIRLHSLVTHSVLQLNFKILYHLSYISQYTYSPPFRCISIGIRAYAHDIWFNHLGVRFWIANLDLYLHTFCLCTHGYDVTNIDMWKYKMGIYLKSLGLHV